MSWCFSTGTEISDIYAVILYLVDLAVDIVMMDPNMTRCEDGHDCSYYAVCVDSDDGYVCRCHKGYYGDGRTCIGNNRYQILYAV